MKFTILYRCPTWQVSIIGIAFLAVCSAKETVAQGITVDPTIQSGKNYVFKQSDAEEKQPQEDDAQITKLADAKRGAALGLQVKVGATFMSGLGAFISDDGLALVDLGMIALTQKPMIVTEAGTFLDFGTILGIFPDQELALMKFDHNPNVWLRFAQKEPDINETIALVALMPHTFRPKSVSIPPVVGRVMAKRSGIGPANSRQRKFVRHLSLGSGLTAQQAGAGAIGPGSFAVDRQGNLVAFKAGIEMGKKQMLIHLAPVVALAEEVEKFIKEGNAIPFPLPKDRNPIDLALTDKEFSDMEMAVRQGESAEADRLLNSLLKRYPESRRLGALALSSNREIDPRSQAGQQVEWLLEQAALAGQNGDYEGGIGKLQKALALSPKDYPNVRISLGAFYANHLERPEEAERFLRDALSSMPESIDLIEDLIQLLDEKKGTVEEATKLLNRIFELEKIYSNW